MLDVAQAFAAERGIAEEELLDWRLAPDMFPLRDQIRFTCNLIRQWAGRASGTPIPSDVEEGCDARRLKDTIDDARAYLASLDRSSFDGRDHHVIEVDLGSIKPAMSVARWVTGFATTNILFHTSIAYAILRSRSVPIGKADLFAGGL